jgi:hypothetical protein
VAEIEVDTAVVGQEPHCVVLRDVLWILPGEIYVFRERVGRREPRAGGKVRCWGVPRTVDHSDSMVRWNSYIVTVNPESRLGLSWVSGKQRQEKKPTVCLVVLVHVDKRVKIDVTVEVYVGPAQRSQMDRSLDGLLGREVILDAPIVPEIL